MIDRRHQTGKRFTRDQFRYAPEENAYYCPQGQPLRYRRAHPTAHGDIYSTTPEQCRGCPQKQRCTPGVVRRPFVHREEAAREIVCALAGTPAYARSQRERYKVEALFAELKQRLRLGRLRLRRLWNAAEQFHLAATEQNLKRLVQFVARGQPVGILITP